jgi:hypothetical protein
LVPNQALDSGRKYHAVSQAAVGNSGHGGRVLNPHSVRADRDGVCPITQSLPQDRTHDFVRSAQRRWPRVARNRLLHHQRRTITCSGLRTNCAMKRISTIELSSQVHQQPPG